jgi:hypothetical protein
MAGPEEWEGAAAELLDATCTTAPVNVLDLAAACGLDVQYWARAGAKTDLDAATVWVESRARPERLQGLVAHELGHVALDRAGLEQSERGATYVGGALRLPRREMLRDLRETAWSLEALRARHPHASATAIAVRITQLRTACLALFDPNGRTPPWRVAGETIGRDLAARPTALEHELAVEAWVEQREVRRGELLVATPLPHYTEGEHRVLVVGHAAELRRAA